MDVTKTYQNWKQEIDADRILWLSVDRQGSSVNSFNRALIAELNDILDGIEKNDSLVGVIIRSAKPSGFIAGADIEQFTLLKSTEEAFELVRQAQTVFDKLAGLRIPTVAMIEGFCLGGGLELALACRYRAAEESPKTQLGAPEVKIGVHPGWGGTVRLPKLIGIIPAMEINLSGRPVSAKAALKLGLVDAVTPKRDIERAARSFVLKKPPVQRPSFAQEMLEYSWLRPLLAKIFYKKLAQQRIGRAHYPAPYAIIDNWVKEGTGDKAMNTEARSIAELLLSPTSRNLVRIFFIQTRMKAFGKDVKFKPKHIHVIGAGTMGGDIAAWCALRGLQVTLQDRTPELIAPAMKRAQELFQKKLKIPRLVQAAMDRLIPDVQGLGIPKADVVLEAIFENLKVKQALYKEIEPQLKEGAILATNTSSLSLEELSKGLMHPDRLVGIHFFNPVAKMQLVEVVHAPHTDKAVVNKALAFVRGIDRLPLPVKSSPGFLVNRVLMPYLLEAMMMIDEGISPEEIDKAAVNFGMPMGPVELADVVGLDVCLAVAEVLAPVYGVEVPAHLRAVVSKGHLGKKSGQGFYTYKDGKAVRDKASQTSSVKMDITDRLILRMVNESVACWREKIVADADLIDGGMVFGTGFAPFLGGPMNYAKTQGFEAIYQRLNALQAKYGERFTPDKGFAELTAAGAKQLVTE